MANVWAVKSIDVERVAITYVYYCVMIKQLIDRIGMICRLSQEKKPHVKMIKRMGPRRTLTAGSHFVLYYVISTGISLYSSGKYS